jgi:hypothetical protein
MDFFGAQTLSCSGVDLPTENILPMAIVIPECEGLNFNDPDFWLEYQTLIPMTP